MRTTRPTPTSGTAMAMTMVREKKKGATMRLILTQDWSPRTSRVKSKMDRSSQEKVKSQRDKHLVRLPWGMGKMGRDRLLRWAARQREVLVVLIILRLAHWHTLLHLGLQIRLPDPEIRDRQGQEGPQWLEVWWSQEAKRQLATCTRFHRRCEDRP